jgi:hypothetical protein
VEKRASVDIAYKPAASGWGFTKRYGEGYDRIFKRKEAAEGQQQAAAPPPARSPPEAP